MKLKHYMNIAVFLALACLLLPFAALSGETTAPPSEEETSQGNVAVQRTDAGVVEDLELKDYLVGVLFAEIPHTYEEEALKAQVVAAHSLMLYRKERANGEFDVTDSPLSDQGCLDEAQAREKYGDEYEAARTKFERAVEAVIGYTVQYEGSIALATYHDISAGKTEAAETMWDGGYAYLTAVESVGDLLSPDYLSTKKFTESELAKALGGEVVEDFVENAERSPSGTVLETELCGKTFTGTEVRKLLDLRSANFDVKREDGEYIFTVRGHGHGVGMSQYGANYMASLGSTFTEILGWYYPSSEIVSEAPK